ncbi:DUF4760 domain-containing protein [Modestobacter excelsi]|uniref:DUF4760 domain-containing protein n=1 Tax=Modestobacter excelsi TaxID=2213161 RepID=UPI00110D0C0A|nr:hypothetical protein [Modestobacter excelsi]
MKLSEVATLAVSVLALLVAMRSNQRSVKVARASQALSVVKDIFGQRGRPDFVEALNAVRAIPYPLNTNVGIEGLPDGLRNKAKLVMAFYEDLGKLVAHGIVDEDLIIGALGHSVVWAWTPLERFILAQREKNQTEYFIYFQHLAARAMARTPKQVHKKLGLVTGRPWWRRLLA